MRDSRWFKEGQVAYAQGFPPEYCPYGARSAKALIWLEGYAHDKNNPNVVPVDSAAVSA